MLKHELCKLTRFRGTQVAQYVVLTNLIRVSLDCIAHQYSLTILI